MGCANSAKVLLPTGQQDSARDAPANSDEKAAANVSAVQKTAPLSISPNSHINNNNNNSSSNQQQTTKLKSGIETDISFEKRSATVKETENTTEILPITQQPKHSSSIKKIQYQKGELIGKGAYGCVYQGLDINTGQLLAIKNVKVGNNIGQVQKEIQALKKEIGLLKSLRHKNIVRYYQFEICEDYSGVDIVLEYLPGGSLRKLLDKFGAFDERMASLYTRQILEGLRYLHNHKVIHRDIKCDNILIGSDANIKLTDFGTSKKLIQSYDGDMLANNDGVQKSKSFKGTPYWMSPELVRMEGHSYPADIWSVGCVVLEMLTTLPPYTTLTRNVREVLKKIANGEIPPYPENISPKCRQFLDGCLDTNAQTRKTAEQLLETDFIKAPEQLPQMKQAQSSTLNHSLKELYPQQDNLLQQYQLQQKQLQKQQLQLHQQQQQLNQQQQQLLQQPVLPAANSEALGNKNKTNDNNNDISNCNISFSAQDDDELNQQASDALAKDRKNSRLLYNKNLLVLQQHIIKEEEEPISSQSNTKPLDVENLSYQDHSHIAKDIIRRESNQSKKSQKYEFQDENGPNGSAPSSSAKKVSSVEERAISTLIAQQEREKVQRQRDQMEQERIQHQKAWEDAMKRELEMIKQMRSNALKQAEVVVPDNQH